MVRLLAVLTIVAGFVLSSGPDLKFQERTVAGGIAERDDQPATAKLIEQVKQERERLAGC